MAEGTTDDHAMAPGGAPIVDQPEVMTSANDPTAKIHDGPRLDEARLLFVVDHDDINYLIPWDQVRQFAQFKSFVEEIYTRKRDNTWLNKIRNDHFHAAIDVDHNTHVVLPSLWTDLVHGGMTVRISFWRRERVSPTPVRIFSRGRERDIEFVDVDVDADDESNDPWYETGTPKRVSSIPSDEEDIEEVESSSEDDEKVSEEPSVEPIRAVIKPVDHEGNELSVAIDTRWPVKHMSGRKEGDSSRDTLLQKILNGRDMVTETLKITKAITTTTENRTTLEVHTLPGPESNTFSSGIQIRWFHLHGDALDWNRFKDTCLLLPNLSERTKTLIVQTLLKIEKEYKKAFLGGMFIEPGTVIRGDECNQPDPQSVIFSCVPYLEIRKPLQSNVQTNHLYPARTLMQSYYPYEPVQQRDEEQAYRKFSNARAGELIHVPSLWMLNVCGRAVVTCGHGPLSSDFTKSIKVVQEDLKQLGAGKENSITTVRLRDLDGRVLLYSPRECSTYFQLEQRVRELRRYTSNSWYMKAPQLLFQGHQATVRVAPANWPAIVGQQNVIFIDISVVEAVSETTSTSFSSTSSAREPTKRSVPPFYHWRSPLSKDEMALESLSADIRHSIRCLEQVEKAMLEDTLPEFDTHGPVDRTFTSTKYYESLPEDTFDSAEKPLVALNRTQDPGTSQSHRTHHQFVISTQYSKLASNAHKFLTVAHDTLGLFVGDVEKYTLLRKVWGAMVNIAAIVQRLGLLPASAVDPKEYSDPTWKTPKTKTRSWRIRTSTVSYTQPIQRATKFDLPLPNDDNEFGASLKRCRRCVHEETFDDPNAALKHLRKHAAAALTKQGGSKSGSLVKDDEELKDWVYNDDQALFECTIAGAVVVLDRAIEEARTIYEQLRELADGVRDGEGALSDLYTFPRKLLDTLHRLLVFYFAVERSLHYTEENFAQTKKGGRAGDYPYSNYGLRVLDKFSDSVKLPLLQARAELCEMVRSSTPNDTLGRMSWGSESISSWLIRRLIVKPLEKSMTIGDMYREYLTTLQFQVNHRPGKRLLRSINLLEEELRILWEVNDWQTRLVNNYIRVLDDATYPVDIPYRRGLYPFERRILEHCVQNLDLTREEYNYQIRRCGPLSDSTKQSAEINEEDHGKAILVFTVVTVIFLPLSFVTSYLGMNTSDIRDMDSKQGLFWEIALPLTVGVMAIMLAIAYNGDEVRDFLSSSYRFLTGKQDRRLPARGISVLQRNPAAQDPSGTPSMLSTVDDAEYVAPRVRPDYYHETAIYDETIDRLKKLEHDVYDDTDDRLKRKLELRYLPDPGDRQQSGRSRRPMFTRIQSKRIVPSVLDEENLDWEYDPQDPNYVVVKKEMEPWETDRLFRESRRVMEGDVYVSKTKDYDDRVVGQRSGYTWMSKKEKMKYERARKGDKLKEKY